MTETHSKIRALFLAGLMVMSVFAMTVALSGSAAAIEHSNRGANAADTWETADGEGEVGDGAVVFQGEDDIDFSWTPGTNSPYEAEELTNSDDDPLSMAIDSDADTTSYNHITDTDYNVIVRNPEISDHEFQLEETGGDIAGGTVPADQNITVWADYNFGHAEDLKVSVFEDDLNVTGEVIDDNTNSSLADGPTDVVSFDLNLDALDAGEYTVELEGVDDLNENDALVSDTFTISGEDDVSINLGQSEAVQGENVRFDVEGGLEGNYHLVTVSDDYDTNNADNIFRNVGDTHSVGDGRAVVEIDGGVGTGSVESQYLDDTDVDVRVSNPISDFHSGWDPSTDDAGAVDTSSGDYEEADDTTLTVTEGEISLENPSDFYVPGADVTVNGTVSEAYGEVSLFARDQGDYQRVYVGSSQQTISATDGEFEAEDVDLSNAHTGDGNDILKLPGTYRFAAVAGDANETDTLSSSEVVRNVSDIMSLRVSEAELEAEASIINGQVAVGDGVDVTGVAQGADEVTMTFFGPRGQIGADSTTVRSDGTFENEDINVQGPPFPNGYSGQGIPGIGDETISISRGTVVMNVGHEGRDGQAGDGTFPDRFESTTTGYGEFTPQQEMILHVNGLHADTTGASFTQQQAIDFMSAETSEDTGSDDQGQVFQFRLSDPRTTIDDVVGQAGASGEVTIGSDMTVEGTTNRQPEQNSITVEVIDGPSAQDFDIDTTEEWGEDGQWNITLPTDGLQPGSYTVEASDGDSSDVSQFQLSEGEVTGNETDTPDGTDTPADTDTPDGTDTPADTDTPTDGGEDTDGEDGPGFGVAIALVALVAAALLAVRRNGN